MLCIPVISACRLDSGETSDYSRHNLQTYAWTEVKSKVIFPVIMAETAMSVEAYEKMSAEEKMQMGYIYRTLIKVDDTHYKMHDFYTFTLSTGGRSISEPGALWVMTSDKDRYELVYMPEDSNYEYRIYCQSYAGDSYVVDFNSIEDENAFYSWEIVADCMCKSYAGYEVQVKTDGPLVRKVYRGNGNVNHSCVMMDGAVTVRISGDNDKDGSMEELDVVKCAYDGSEVRNEVYDF